MEKQVEYILWLVLGSKQVHVLYKEKALLPKFLEFDNLLNTPHMCFKRDLHDLLEDASEIDCFDHFIGKVNDTINLLIVFLTVNAKM